MTARDQLADRIVKVLDPDALDPVAQEVARNVAGAVIGMINTAVLAEREACAQIVGKTPIVDGRSGIAAAIRARNEIPD